MAFAHSTVVKLFVGPERVPFEVHKSFLTTKIGHFARMLSPESGFKEEKENEIVMGDMTPEVGELLCGWLYRGELPRLEPLTTKETEAQQEASGALAKEKPYHALLYQAEMWLCSALSKDLFDRIRQYHLESGIKIHSDLVFDGVRNLPKNSGFRRFLLVHIIAFCTNGTNKAHHVADMRAQLAAAAQHFGDETEGFLTDLMGIMITMVKAPSLRAHFSHQDSRKGDET